MVDQGIVVAGSSMPRSLGRAWPPEFRSELTTGVRLNSSKYGKYSRTKTRIYQTFVPGVPAAMLMQTLSMPKAELTVTGFSDLIEACRQYVDQSENLPVEALLEFVAEYTAPPGYEQ